MCHFFCFLILDVAADAAAVVVLVLASAHFNRKSEATEAFLSLTFTPISISSRKHRWKIGHNR